MRIQIISRAFTLGWLATGLTGTAVRAQAPTFELELEGGAAWQSKNDVEVPNDGSATRFSLVDLIGAGPSPAGRAYLTWNVADRHAVRVLVAPFTLRERGAAPSALRFAGADYSAGQSLDATYTFNSYRVSYRWRAHAGPNLTGWLGFTAKIRDAAIALAQGAIASRKDDVGFVPLLHLSGEWRPAGGWRLSIDADGLAGGPGRAIDAALKMGYDVTGRWSVRAGYRTVEGGADVDAVYAFAWLHYAVVSVDWRR